LLTPVEDSTLRLRFNSWNASRLPHSRIFVEVPNQRHHPLIPRGWGWRDQQAPLGCPCAKVSGSTLNMHDDADSQQRTGRDPASDDDAYNVHPGGCGSSLSIIGRCSTHTTVAQPVLGLYNLYLSLPETCIISYYLLPRYLSVSSRIWTAVSLRSSFLNSPANLDIHLITLPITI
jgi:hypothetical protein